MEEAFDFWIPYLATNFVALLLLYVCIKWYKAGRITFGIIFLIAAGINAFTAINKPAAYLAYEKYTLLDFYEAFITGFFARNTTMIVLSIALGQLLIAAGLLFFRKWTRTAAAGAMAFLIAIAPLGFGSAFPASLIMALAVFMIWRKT